MKKEKCFDSGTIQAFTDGELASDLAEKLIKHISLCDSCAILLAETEDENAFAFSVLDEELNTLVPTERLRTKVFDSIRKIKQKEKIGWRQRLTGSFGFANGFSFKNPLVNAFASIFLFVSVLAVGMNFYNSTPNQNEVAFNAPAIDSFEVDKIDMPSFDVREEKVEQDFAVTKAAVSDDSQINEKYRSSATPKPQKAVFVPKVKPDNSSEDHLKLTPPKANPNLAEESGYLQTIATLNKTVNQTKDLTLRPTERIAYERDLAVVDDAIRKMKAEVRKNPDNQAAREVLRSSYQNKIDLLNSVAEKNEMIASIQ